MRRSRKKDRDLFLLRGLVERSQEFHDGGKVKVKAHTTLLVIVDLDQGGEGVHDHCSVGILQQSLQGVKESFILSHLGLKSVELANTEGGGLPDIGILILL